MVLFTLTFPSCLALASPSTYIVCIQYPFRSGGLVVRKYSRCPCYRQKFDYFFALAESAKADEAETSMCVASLKSLGT